MSVKRLFGAVLSLCLAAPLAAQAGPYSNLYVFGDSLSDGGSDLNLSSALNAISGGAFPLIPAPGASPLGRFSNGFVAVDYLANALGLPLTAHYVTPPFLGGTTAGNNYAQGGATSGLVNASVPGTITLGPNTVATGFKGMTAEITDYTSTHAAADPDAAYILWSGANDFIHPGSAGVAAGCSSANPIASAICTAVSNITQGVATLAALGAHHIVVPNLPDLGATADSIAGGPVAIAQGHALTVTFNAALAQSLGALSTFYIGDIVQFDLYGVFNQILADPYSYGFTNTTMSCLSGSVADATSTVTAACAVAGADRYIFWDPIHPTTAAQAIIGQRLAAAFGVPEPSELALFGLGLFAFFAAPRRSRTHQQPMAITAA
ncbi:MAG: SGNH/GDSL hydrolase family protein [Burkholderiaceae bacterium]